MTLYENDFYIRTGVNPEYVRSYRGFFVGLEYDIETQKFSSRNIKLDVVWPNREVRTSWQMLRNTQITTIPSGVTVI